MSNICIICGEKYDRYGHNAQPIIKGRCCDVCDKIKVMPERLRQVMSNRS